MKVKNPLQIVTVALALTMLTAYVVYSQHQQTRNVAPGSKVMVLEGVKGPSASAGNTNNVRGRKPVAVAPGSKSLAPVLTVRPTTLATASNAPAAVARPAMVAPGSKSAAVFDLQQSQVPKTPKLKPAHRAPLTPSNDETKTNSSPATPVKP